MLNFLEEMLITTILAIVIGSIASSQLETTRARYGKVGGSVKRKKWEQQQIGIDKNTGRFMNLRLLEAQVQRGEVLNQSKRLAWGWLSRMT